MEMRMAKTSFLLEFGNRLENCFELCGDLVNGVETLRNQFSKFSPVNVNRGCVDFLCNVSGPVYTPYPIPLAIIGNGLQNVFWKTNGNILRVTL